MNRSTKNIIVIIIMVIMIVCSYFTINKLNYKNIPDMSNDRISISDKFNKDIKNDNTTNDSNNINDNNQKRDNNRNRPDDIKNRPNNFNFDNKDFNPVKNDNNLIYLILFEIEGAIIGGCAVYLLLLNTNKLKENKK